MNAIVKARPGESADKLIQRFNRELVHSGFFQELKEKITYYKKPSLLKQEREKERLKKIRENNR